MRAAGRELSQTMPYPLFLLSRCLSGRARFPLDISTIAFYKSWIDRCRGSVSAVSAQGWAWLWCLSSCAFGCTSQCPRGVCPPSPLPEVTTCEPASRASSSVRHSSLGLLVTPLASVLMGAVTGRGPLVLHGAGPTCHLGVTVPCPAGCMPRVFGPWVARDWQVPRPAAWRYSSSVVLGLRRQAGTRLGTVAHKYRLFLFLSENSVIFSTNGILRPLRLA